MNDKPVRTRGTNTADAIVPQCAGNAKGAGFMRIGKTIAGAVSRTPDGDSGLIEKYRVAMYEAGRINSKPHIGVEDTDCISFKRTEGGSAHCSALSAAYCMVGSCSFQKTAAEAAHARFKTNATRLGPHL